MTENYTITIVVPNKEVSEVVQRLAFSFGYKWRNSTQEVYEYNLVLTFDETNKLIAIGYENDSGAISSVNQLLERFKNPKTSIKVLGVTIYNNGDVELGTAIKLTDKGLKEVLAARRKFLGKKR